MSTNSPPMQNMVKELTEILRTIYPDTVWDDSATDTARRVIKTWKEFQPKPADFNPTVFDATDGMHKQMIVVTGIEFSSLCAHHLLPFKGTAAVGYIPHKKMIGLSKIPRLVHHFASRPQVQERLSHQIASELNRLLDPKGVGVLMNAQHTCMACRGIREHNGMMVTSEMGGIFLTAPAARAEFLQAAGKG